MTSAPVSTAIWTAKLPTPPVAPTIRTLSPALRLNASTAESAVTPARGVAPAAARSTPDGRLATPRLRHRDALGPGPLPDGRVGVQDEAEHVGAHRERRAGPGLLDDTGEVAAEDDREVVLEHPVEHPGGDRVVDRVDRGGLHPHEHLALGGDRGSEIAEGGRSVEAVEAEGAHACIVDPLDRSTITIYR